MINKKIFASILTAIFFIMNFGLKVQAEVPKVRIGILSEISQVNLQTSEPCKLIDSTTRQEIQKIEQGKIFTISFSAMKNNSVEIIGGENLQTSVNGKKYFGGVRINKNSNSLTVINIVPVEKYLCGVVPKEMSPSFSEQALKAQAVAARSFTLKNKGLHEKDGYDLCATNHCQFYDGGAAANEKTDKAVQATQGEVLYFNGEVARTNFHTDSGGMTEANSNVWGAEIPYLQPAAELTKQTQAWTVKFSKKDFSARMGAAFGDLNSVKLSNLVIGKSSADRTTSGRVKTAEFVGSKKTVQMSGNEIRSKFSLPSTLFNIKIQGEEIIFEGYGRGHGIGMSQYGAEAYSKNGWTYDKILKHYYKGTEIKKVY